MYAQYPDNSIPSSAIIGGVGSGGIDPNTTTVIGNDDIVFGDDDFVVVTENPESNNNKNKTTIDYDDSNFALIKEDPLALVGIESSFTLTTSEYVTYDNEGFLLIKEITIRTLHLETMNIKADLHIKGDIAFEGTVRAPTPQPTQHMNTVATIGYIHSLGFITADGLLKQFGW